MYIRHEVMRKYMPGVSATFKLQTSLTIFLLVIILHHEVFICRERDDKKDEEKERKRERMRKNKNEEEKE